MQELMTHSSTKLNLKVYNVSPFNFVPVKLLVQRPAVVKPEKCQDLDHRKFQLLVQQCCLVEENPELHRLLEEEKIPLHQQQSVLGYLEQAEALLGQGKQ